jgi:ferritin-like protein
MGKVAREIVEKSGIKVDELLKKLVAAAGAEFTTFYIFVRESAATGQFFRGLLRHKRRAKSHGQSLRL